MSVNAEDTIHVRLGSAEKKKLVVKFARENGYSDTSEFIRYLIDTEMGCLSEKEDPFMVKLRNALKKPEVKKILLEILAEK